jgi:hypothetical protein
MSKVSISGNALGTGTITLAAPNTSTDRTLTLPDATGTFAILDSAGNFKLSAAGAVLQNSSGNPILRQSGSVLKVQQFTNAGSSTTSGTLVNLNGSAFLYTPVSTSSTLYLTITAYTYLNPAAGHAAGAIYGFYAIGEFISSVWTPISNTGYLWSYQYPTTYGQSIATQANMTCTRSNSALTARSFNLMGAMSNANMTFFGNNIILTIMEVAN